MNKRGLKLQCSHFVPLGVEGKDGRLPCVVYCHCNSGSRRDAEEAIFVLIPLGVSVFTLDFAGSGLSEGQFVNLGASEVDDVEVNGQGTGYTLKATHTHTHTHDFIDDKDAPCMTLNKSLVRLQFFMPSFESSPGCCCAPPLHREDLHSRSVGEVHGRGHLTTLQQQRSLYRRHRE